MDFVRSHFRTNELEFVTPTMITCRNDGVFPFLHVKECKCFDQLIAFFLTFWPDQCWSGQKVRKKVFNWSEVYLYRRVFLQNPYFSVKNNSASRISTNISLFSILKMNSALQSGLASQKMMEGLMIEIRNSFLSYPFSSAFDLDWVDTLLIYKNLKG